MLNGVSEIQNYKPMQKWHMSNVVLGKGFDLNTPNSFDCDFTQCWTLI
jgi:hypothetical protein